MQPLPSQLTASLLTPPGRGAVAVIRVHDAALSESTRLTQAIDSCFAAVNGRAIRDQPSSRLCYGHWETDDTREDVVVCRTDTTTVEISCHGGRVAVDRVLGSLKHAGASVVDWQTQQEVMSSGPDAETANALSQATTARAAAVLLDQASGTLKDAFTRMLSLDADELAIQIDHLLAQARFGLHLTEPWRVVLAGRPNVGKSTLINALLGYTRAIVFDQPGTTRDVVTGQTAFDGWPFELADTAGIRITTDELERAGIDRARRTLETADLVCLLLDTSQAATEEDHVLLAEVNDIAATKDRQAIIVAHKADLPNRWDGPLPAQALPVSSTTGAGMEKLIATIVKLLIPAAPSPGTPVPISRRQVAWLRRSQSELQDGKLNEAVAAIQRCLAGIPFDHADSESEIDQ